MSLSCYTLTTNGVIANKTHAKTKLLLQRCMYVELLLPLCRYLRLASPPPIQPHVFLKCVRFLHKLAVYGMAQLDLFTSKKVYLLVGVEAFVMNAVYM